MPNPRHKHNHYLQIAKKILNFIINSCIKINVASIKKKSSIQIHVMAKPGILFE